ncbi:MAG: response regulator [Pirellulaceae bacterium]|nr:response regulator [Planctomycetales bacterium]MCA9163227.1 response regulator [Planctomycetales bacterium]MCA9203337.1 response regulator [Planctomycetales bacterium]MCA9207226.1 response regulator [Planctomycetales bacterium]MCA9225415.1 response regulator [Planctomycetales bacterium]
MLVLSRKERQEFVFPGLGITVQIVRVQGKTVRVGIEAPENIRVLRGELPVEDDSAEEASTADEKNRHAYRNRLNTLHLALALLQAQLEGERFDEAEITLAKALEKLAELEGLTDSATALCSSSSAKRPARRALIVEDNAQERELLAEYLRMHGYEVHVANDGKTAMDFLACHHCPDLVLLDMNMPGMNGQETARAIRCDSRFEKTKLFVLSGSDPGDYECGFGSYEIDHWFSKPIRPKDFVSQLERELAAA